MGATRDSITARIRNAATQLEAVENTDRYFTAYGQGLIETIERLTKLLQSGALDLADENSGTAVPFEEETTGIS